MSLRRDLCASQQEYDADSSACEATAGQAASTLTGWGTARSRVYSQCMRGKGWEAH